MDNISGRGHVRVWVGQVKGMVGQVVGALSFQKVKCGPWNCVVVGIGRNGLKGKHKNIKGRRVMNLRAAQEAGITCEHSCRKAWMQNWTHAERNLDVTPLLPVSAGMEDFCFEKTQEETGSSPVCMFLLSCR
jgi:hypothetical protein